MAGQQWSVAADGGYLANPQLSKDLRREALPLMKFRQFVRVVPGFGKGKGDTVLFDRVSKVQTAGGKLTEGTPIPETKVLISREQLVIDEWGNSIPYTGKLEALAQWDPNNIVERALRDDMAMTLDKAVGEVFKSTLLKYVPQGTTSAPSGLFTTNLGTTAATRPFSVFDLKEIIDAMKSTYRIEPYDGQDYIAVGSVGFTRALKDDPDWEEAVKYGDPSRLFTGEVGRLYGCRFVEETNVLSNVLGTTTYKGEAVFFGADPVVEAVAIPEEIRAKIPEDYGRSKGVAWYALLGFGLTFATANPGEVRVIHVTSA